MILFKEQISPIFGFTATWTGKTNRNCNITPIYMQAYNRNTNEWDTLTFDDTSIAGANISLIGSRFINFSNYLNGSNEVAIRIYQEVK